MIYPQIVRDVYKRFDEVLNAWNEAVQVEGNIGAFIFLPDDYLGAGSFDELEYGFWSIEKIESYLTKGGQSIEGLDRLVLELEFGHEFLVMIIERTDASSKVVVHFHKMSQEGMN